MYNSGLWKKSQVKAWWTEDGSAIIVRRQVKGGLMEKVKYKDRFEKMSSRANCMLDHSEFVSWFDPTYFCELSKTEDKSFLLKVQIFSSTTSELCF